MPTPPIEVERVPFAAVDLRTVGLEDRQLLLAPHHDEPWDRMISNDAGMLEQQERELAVLGYARLSLIPPVATGHDPIRSTGLVVAHIENIASHTTPGQTTGLATGGTHRRWQSPRSIREDAREARSRDPIDLLPGRRRPATSSRGVRSAETRVGHLREGVDRPIDGIT